MKQNKLKRSGERGCLSAAALLIFAVSLAATEVDANRARKWVIKGIPTTGPNDICGEPQWKLPEPLPPDAHFTFIGQHNPNPEATDAIPLSPENCQSDTLLATTIDPDFLAFLGFPNPDPRLQNLPLRAVQVIAGFDGVRSALPPADLAPPNPLPPAKSRPDTPITLGDWFRVRSSMTVRCFQDGKADVKATFYRLIPNGVYTMFGIWKTTPPGAPGPTFRPIAFGGFPNVIVADTRGFARFERELEYCPKDPTPDGSVLMFVDLAYQADGHTYGAFPFTPLGAVKFRDPDGSVYESTLPPGAATFVQVGFPITVEPLR